MSRDEAAMTKQTKEVPETAKHHNHHHPKSYGEVFLLVCSTEPNNWNIQEPGEAKPIVGLQNKNWDSHRF